MATYKILTLDGGGMKGLFSTTLLERLVTDYPALIANVDLIGGTSTGGIIALGLANGKSPAALSALYRNNGEKIFDDSFWDDLIDLGKAVGADYGHRGLKRILKKEFGDAKLRDLGKRVLISSFDLDAPAKSTRPRMWKPKFFHNFPGRDSDGKELVVEVGIRTSAAPTYFPSYQGYIDGGVVANNPSVAALAQALDERGGKQKLEDVVLLSIGTGVEPKNIPGKKHDWGWGQWARPLVSLIISGLGGVADFQCQQLLGAQYQRLNAYFTRGVDLDDTRPTTLSYLVDEAYRVRLDSTLEWLEKHGW